MWEEELYRQITEAVISGDEETAIKLTQEGVAQGLDPIEIINRGYQPGLDIIGQEYETGVCFVPELITAGNIMQAAMVILEDELNQRSESRQTLGKVVLGTVAGDIHSIGKDLVGTMLSLNGFEVIDLGANVPTPEFIEKVREVKEPILGLSALITTTMQVQQEIIKALEDLGIREQVKVVIGGAPTSQDWADQIGADGYAAHATRAVTVCKQMVGL